MGTWREMKGTPWALCMYVVQTRVCLFLKWCCKNQYKYMSLRFFALYKDVSSDDKVETSTDTSNLDFTFSSAPSKGTVWCFGTSLNTLHSPQKCQHAYSDTCYKQLLSVQTSEGTQEPAHIGSSEASQFPGGVCLWQHCTCRMASPGSSSLRE